VCVFVCVCVCVCVRVHVCLFSFSVFCSPIWRDDNKVQFFDLLYGSSHISGIILNIVVSSGLTIAKYLKDTVGINHTFVTFQLNLNN
jgi:hypothetical protein